METSRDWQAIDLSAGTVMRWFLDATNDPEKRNPILGQKSFDKLAELGQIRDWMAWLKEQLDQAEAQGREHLQRELARAAPDRPDRGEDKWQVVIRLCSPAQSIRSRDSATARRRLRRCRAFVRLAHCHHSVHEPWRHDLAMDIADHRRTHRTRAH